MNFDEFRQCLLSGGMGLNKKEAKQLFMAIGGSVHPRGGEGKLGEVDILFAYINKYPVGTEKGVSTKLGNRLKYLILE